MVKLPCDFVIRKLDAGNFLAPKLLTRRAHLEFFQRTADPQLLHARILRYHRGLVNPRPYFKGFSFEAVADTAVRLKVVVGVE
jgi:hypothetical protein